MPVAHQLKVLGGEVLQRVILLSLPYYQFRERQGGSGELLPNLRLMRLIDMGVAEGEN
jgi:hypothetical protein